MKIAVFPNIYNKDVGKLTEQIVAVLFELGFEEAVYEGVCLIEWPEQAGNWLPRDIFKIEITSNKNERIFKISAHSSEKAKRLEDL